MYFDIELDAHQLADLRQLVAPLIIEEQMVGSDFVDGHMVIGCRAGPSIDLHNAMHEISHFIEIDRARMTTTNWGLKMPWVECSLIREGGYVEFTKDQHIQREIRVWAIQTSLSNHRGLKVTPSDLASSAIYLPQDYMICSDPSQRIHRVTHLIEELLDKPEYGPEALLAEFHDRRISLMANKTRA